MKIMKKIGLLCLVLILALGAMGTGLAFWTDTLTLNGTVATGDLDVSFINGYSNDEGNDPGLSGGHGDGTYNPDTGYDAASCTVAIVNAKTATMSIDNGYPSYAPLTSFDIHNTGTIPAKVSGFILKDSLGDPVAKIPYVSLIGWEVTMDGTPIYAGSNGRAETVPFTTVDETYLGDGTAARLMEYLKTVTFEDGNVLDLHFVWHLDEAGSYPGAEDIPENETIIFSVEIEFTQFNAP